MTPAEQILQLHQAPKLPGAQDIKAMNRRVLALDALYDLDGRSDPGHPNHNTYTGLFQKYIQI